MKTIRYNKEFTRPDGYPFFISNPDPAVQEKAIEEAIVAGRQIAHVPQIPARFFADVIIWFMNGLPFERDDKGQPVRKQTAEDIGNNYAVIKEFRQVTAEGGNQIELEDQVHTWLVKQIDLEGPTAFGNSQAQVASRLNDLVPDPSEPSGKGKLSQAEQ